MCITVGTLNLDRVFLAPMTGISDPPFRRLARRLGCQVVFSEMIASRSAVIENRRTRRMLDFSGERRPWAMQLAGADPAMMAEAARLAADRGVDLIDINMGCPVKKVVHGSAGSALMRDLKHAAKIIEATVNSVSIPVTLKMRTGWDDETRNAPELARIAADLGVCLIAIHGRTRCQFYTGRADWDFIAQVKQRVTIPVIANGDISTFDDASEVLTRSGADGVMIGRAALGRPWFPGAVSRFLKTGQRTAAPNLERQAAIIEAHYQAMLSHYGTDQGMRVARKHLARYADALPDPDAFRNHVLTEPDADRVLEAIRQAFVAGRIAA